MSNFSRPLDLTEVVCDAGNVSRVVDILCAKIKSRAQRRMNPFSGEITQNDGTVQSLDESSIAELSLLNEARDALVKLLITNEDISEFELDVMLSLMKNQEVEQMFRKLAFFLRTNHQGNNTYSFDGEIIPPFDYKNIRERIIKKLQIQKKALFEWAKRNIKDFQNQIFVVTSLGVYLKNEGDLRYLPHDPSDMDMDLSGKVEITGESYFVFVERDNDGQSPGYFLSYYDSTGAKVSPTMRYKGEEREVCFIEDEFGIMHVYLDSWIHTSWIGTGRHAIGELTLKDATVELGGWGNIWKQSVPLRMQKK